MAKWIEPSELLESAPSESRPFLLALARRQAGRRTPRDLVKQYASDRFVEPSMLDLRLVHQLDALALEAAQGFDALLLSPVAPLGSCSVLAPTSQDRTLSTNRATEVVSDPTNVLVLESARRLEAQPSESVRLCTVHQVLRAQALPPDAGFSRHFRLFALAEAGRARAEHAFEVDAVVRHLTVFNTLFDRSAALGCVLPCRRATLFASERQSVLASRLQRRIEQELGHVEIVREPFESNYYDGVRVLFGADNSQGEHCPLADVGLFSWVQKLTNNEKLRFVASGVGIQLLPLLFRPTAQSK